MSSANRRLLISLPFIDIVPLKLPMFETIFQFLLRVALYSLMVHIAIRVVSLVLRQCYGVALGARVLCATHEQMPFLKSMKLWYKSWWWTTCFSINSLILKIFSVVLLFGRMPDCSSDRNSSAAPMNRSNMIISIILLGWLIRLIVL